MWNHESFSGPSWYLWMNCLYFLIQKELSDMIDLFGTTRMKQNGNGSRKVTYERNGRKKFFCNKNQSGTKKQLVLYHTVVFLDILIYITGFKNFYDQWQNTFCREDQYLTPAGFSRMSDWQSPGNSKRFVLGIFLKKMTSRWQSLYISLPGLFLSINWSLITCGFIPCLHHQIKR